jgi:hypothetical protein
VPQSVGMFAIKGSTTTFVKDDGAPEPDEETAAFIQERTTSLRAIDASSARIQVALREKTNEKSGSHVTCMGLFLSSGCYWVLLTVLGLNAGYLF